MEGTTSISSQQIPLGYRQASDVQNIPARPMEQILPSEIGQELVYDHQQRLASSEQPEIWQGSQLPDVPANIGTTSDGKKIIAESSIDQEYDSSFTVSKDFDTFNVNPVSKLSYDEVPFEVSLQNIDSSRLSNTQHGPLFGHATEKLLNFPISDYNLPAASTDNGKGTADGSQTYCEVIIGLTSNGENIIGGLNATPEEEDEQIISTILYMVNSTEKIASIPFSQFLEELDDEIVLNQSHSNEDSETRNEVIAGLTSQSESIIAGLVENNLGTLQHLMPVIMGLTADGEVICASCVAGDTNECTSAATEATFESENCHATLNIIANLTAENEKVLVGSILRNDSTIHSNGITSTATNLRPVTKRQSTHEDAERLIRRDSF